MFRRASRIKESADLQSAEFVKDKVLLQNAAWFMESSLSVVRLRKPGLANFLRSEEKTGEADSIRCMIWNLNRSLEISG
jgi:hypothetical protein